MRKLPAAQIVAPGLVWQIGNITAETAETYFVTIALQSRYASFSALIIKGVDFLNHLFRKKEGILYKKNNSTPHPSNFPIQIKSEIEFVV